MWLPKPFVVHFALALYYYISPISPKNPSNLWIWIPFVEICKKYIGVHSDCFKNRDAARTALSGRLWEIRVCVIYISFYRYSLLPLDTGADNKMQDSIGSMLLSIVYFFAQTARNYGHSRSRWCGDNVIDYRISNEMPRTRPQEHLALHYTSLSPAILIFEPVEYSALIG